MHNWRSFKTDLLLWLAQNGAFDKCSQVFHIAVYNLREGCSIINNSFLENLNKNV